MKRLLFAVLFPSVAFADFLEERTLASGLRVIRVEQSGSPIAAVGLVISGGSALDGPRHGESTLAYSLHFGQGSGAEREELVKALAESGSDFSFSVQEDHVRYVIFGLGDQVDEMIELLGIAVARKGKLERSQFERRRVDMVDSLWEIERNPIAAAHAQLPELTFGTLHPYGHGSLGSRRTLGQIELDDVEGNLARGLCPDRSAVIVAGAVDLERVARVVAKSFSKWKTCKGHSSEIAALPERERTVVPIIHDPGRTQVLVLGAMAAPIRDAADVAALELIVQVLGGSISSRLQVALRSEGGYTYGAHTWLEVESGVGVLFLRTSLDRETASAAVTKLVETVAALRDHPPTAEESQRIQRRLATESAVILRSPVSAFDDVASRFAARLPLVSAGTDDAHVAEMARHIDAARLHLVLVGDGRTLSDVVTKTKLGAPRVIPMTAASWSNVPSSGI